MSVDNVDNYGKNVDNYIDLHNNLTKWSRCDYNSIDHYVFLI